MRYMTEEQAAQLAAEREEWERDQQAIAEYEAWQLDKLLAEQDAEGISEQ